MYDVVIIGAGVIGALTARELMRYKLRVCVVDRESDVAMGATKANSGIVHAGFDAKEGSLKARLNVEGSLMMEAVANELGVKYIKNGSLVIGFDDNDLCILHNLYERGIKNGVRDLCIIDKKRLKELEPNITDEAVGALYAPSGAIVCPYELAIAALGNAMDNGAEFIPEFEVKEIRRDGERFVISNSDFEIETKYAVNCAGVYSDKIASMADCGGFSITPRKGEYLLLDKEYGGLVKHTIFRTPSESGKGILVSPTVDGNLILGPTSEKSADKEDKSTTADGLARVSLECLENVPSINLLGAITSFCGIRAVGDTGDFIINIRNGFVNCVGIESPGLSASPAIAREVVRLLRNDGMPCVENSSFTPRREPSHAFRDMSIEEKNKKIAENPAFGRIVCRCEQVTEGEIIAAIHRNPPALTTDGIKRRTRSGMGRCQSGFCLPSVMEILARETGKSPLSITKSGKGSELNFGKVR